MLARINSFFIGMWLTLLFSCAPFSALAESESEKISRYNTISSKISWEWLKEVEPSTNDHLIKLYNDSGLANDPSSVGIIYRNLLWSSDPWPQKEFLGEKPGRITEKNWSDFKQAAPFQYAVVKATLIFNKWQDVTDASSSENASATQHAVHQLRELRREMLLNGNVSATAWVSAQLGRIFQSVSIIKSIEEFEYAIPHLKNIRPNDKVEWSHQNDRATALYWLASAYNDRQMHKRALTYALLSISETPAELRDVLTHYQAMLAFNKLERFEEALEMASMLIELAENKRDASERFFAILLKSTVYTNRLASGDKDRARALFTQLQPLSRELDVYNKETLIELVNMLSAALDGSSDRELDAAVIRYINAMNGHEHSLPYWRTRAIYNVRRAYELNEDYQKAFEYDKRLDQVIIELNAQQFKAQGDISSDDSLLRDMEMINLRQIEAAHEKQRLENQAQRQRGVILILCILLLATTTFWFWHRHRIVTKLAGVDSLTGAMTRRAIFSWYSVTEFGKSLGCAVLIDLDHFKQINDHYGHLTGDEVLATFSQMVKDRIRKTDKLCRYGGEEFLLMLPDANKKEAENLIDAVREQLKSRTTWNTTQAPLSVNFSAGVIEINKPAELDDLIEQCDALLYTAKKNGRAQTVAAHFEP